MTIEKSTTSTWLIDIQASKQQQQQQKSKIITKMKNESFDPDPKQNNKKQTNRK